MCNSTLAEISHQQADKLRISLTNRFIDPVELLTRYHKFYANAEALIKPTSNMEAITKEFFNKRETEYKNALVKANTTFSYDTENKILHFRFGNQKYKQSIDQGGYLIEIGDDGSIIGIEIFNVIL
jgi:uncharacterized protein YuzE